MRVTVNYRRNGIFCQMASDEEKIGDGLQELPEIEIRLKNLFEQSRQLAVQIRDMSS